MLAQLIKLGVLAGAGYATWKALAKQQKQPFFQQALQSGVSDVEAARSAQLHGAAASVRAFAQQLQREHGEHNLALAQAAGLPMPQPDARQQAALQRLKLQQGEAYDRAWLRHMAKCHRDAIHLYEREVAQGGAGAALASDALPKLREHARRLAELRDGEASQAAASTALPASPQVDLAGYNAPRATV